MPHLCPHTRLTFALILDLAGAGQFELERELDKLNFEEEDFLAEGDAFFEADVRTCITLTAGCPRKLRVWLRS